MFRGKSEHFFYANPEDVQSLVTLEQLSNLLSGYLTVQIFFKGPKLSGILSIELKQVSQMYQFKSFELY